MATIHEATEGPDGKVFRGAVINETQAAARRRRGMDIVVSGDDAAENCQVARGIETQIGPNYHDGPHTLTAGPYALPHWQQDRSPPAGHAFYETHLRKSFAQP
jgi:hypothetical protein